MSRINSARIAGIKAEHAGLEVAGAVMASDAFFPFRDGIDNAAAAGISCVIQPGGSMRDDEVLPPPMNMAWRWSLPECVTFGTSKLVILSSAGVRNVLSRSLINISFLTACIFALSEKPSLPASA